MAFSICSSSRGPGNKFSTSCRFLKSALLAIATAETATLKRYSAASFVCAYFAATGPVLAQSPISTPQPSSEMSKQQRVESVQIPLKGGGTLKATLAVPKSPKLVPAVLIIPGYI